MEKTKSRKSHKAWLAVLALSLTMIMLGFGLTDAYAWGGVDDNKVYNVTHSMTSYDTIQAAIDAAVPGDLLIAGPGTYNESIVVDVENICLASNEGAGNTIIDGGSTAIEVQVDRFTLDGFTISDIDDSSSEFAILIQEVEDGAIDIFNCVVNDAMYGILFNTVTDSTVTLTNNDMPTTWRGAYFQEVISGSNITVDLNTFTDIKAESVFFGKTITDSRVEIDRNSLTDCYNGIQINGDVINTEMNITENDVTGSDYGVYIDYDTVGVYGTSVVTIEENIFDDLTYDGIYVYKLEKGGEAIIKNNIISNSDTGIYVDYVSLDYQDNTTNLYIGGNGISDCDYGIDVDDVYYGSAIIEANNIHNAGYGIYIDHTADGSVETDVQIIDNCITADADNDGLYDGIYICCVEAVTTISGNEISGYDNVDRYDTGIYLEDIGCCGADMANIEVSDNQIMFVAAGIFMNDIACCADADILVAGNVISEADYGLYLENMSSYVADVDVIGNTMRNCDYGIYVYNLYEEIGDERYLTISWNVITGNEVGILLDYVTLEQADPSVWIVSNDITNNGTGLLFGHTPFANEALIVVSFNNFSGNTSYAINMLGEVNDAKAPAKAPSLESFMLEAPLNWWGDATGPEYNDNSAKGDAINGLVNFDPWIQKLVITPKTSTGFEGKSRSFTATLYDSNGDIADVPLAVQFMVTGANKAKGTVDLVNGVGTFKYTGANPGTDSVVAGLVFVEAPVEGLSETAAAIWTAVVSDDPGTDPVDEDSSPNTGDHDNNWYLYTLVMSLLLGLGLVRFQATTLRK